jgi:hypothetical protein
LKVSPALHCVFLRTSKLSVYWFDFLPFYLNFNLHILYIRLDYPGVGPEHSYLKDIGRAEYYSVTDEEALQGQSSSFFLIQPMQPFFCIILPTLQND